MRKSKHERLVGRVRKLYAMAQQTEQSPAEAEAALRNCLKLMDRHGITVADLGTSKFDASSVIADVSADLAYMQLIAGAASTLHDCVAVIQHGKGIEIRGHDVDVMVATMTFDYIKQAMSSAEACRIGHGLHLEPTTENKLHWRTGFAAAISRTVGSIIAQRKRDQASQSGTGTSLVVQKLEAVVANCLEGIPDISADDLYKPANDLATYLGEIEGQKVSFNTQISGSTSSDNSQ